MEGSSGALFIANSKGILEEEVATIIDCNDDEEIIKKEEDGENLGGVIAMVHESKKEENGENLGAVIAMEHEPKKEEEVTEDLPDLTDESVISEQVVAHFNSVPLDEVTKVELDDQDLEHQYMAVGMTAVDGIADVHTGEDHSEDSKLAQVSVKEEQDEAAAPQQFIILTRSAGGTDGAIEVGGGAGGVPSKYLKFEGADGLTYVLAVQDDETQSGLLTESSSTISTQPSQQIVPVKNLTTGKKRSLSTSAPGQASSTAPSSLSATLASPQVLASSSARAVSPPVLGSSSARVKSSHNASVDGINQAWFTTRDDKTALYNEGLKWKQGQWTKEEIDILEENINSYCKEHNIKDPAEVIFERSKEERKDFYRTVALGIHRPLFSVYRRVTRMYDRKNHRGKYTPSEIKNLRSLRAKHGNDWAAIGVALGRSASSVKDKCRLMKDNCNSGKWYPEEEERLAAAVHKLTGVKPSESVTSGLSWAIVADHVGTRSEKQCRTKWLNYLNWKQQGGADWTREDDNLLIERVSKMNVFSDSDIDWVALSQDWASVRSPQWLRGKWWALKRHIPEYNKLSYPALLEQMRQVIYWNMKPKAGNVRQPKSDMEGPGNSSSDFLKGVIPVSVGALSDGSLSLTYCPQDDEGYQAFEVLQSWTPQMLGSVTQTGDSSGEAAPGILSGDGGHIIVQTLGPSLGEGIQLDGQQQVIISTTGMGIQEPGADGREAMTIQVAADGLVHHAGDQDLNVLTTDGLHENTFTTEGEEIVTVAEFHTQVGEGDQDMMTQDVFEAVTSESGGNLVMGVASPTAASSLMTSLKDPILMSSSDVDCEKSQSTELTDENSELID